MKYIQNLFAATLLLIFISCGSYSSDTNKTASVGTIQAKEIDDIVTYLASDELEGRNTGTEGIEKAATYIENYFKQHNIQPYFATYRDNFMVQNDTGFNVIGYLEGNDPKLKNEFVIIGAHYDHIGTGKPVNGDTIANGANDNAAGVSAVMTMAKQFAANKSNKRSIIFALFSAEERGLVGSKYLAKTLKEKNIDLYVMLNFEMIGVPLVGKDYTAYVTGFDKSNLAEKMNEYAGKKIAGFLPKAGEYRLFMRSDNYPFFQEFNVPAQTFSTFDFTNFEYYHDVRDEPATMDFNHMASFVNTFLPAVAKTVNAPTKEIKLN